ncbi:hypothetical protein [Pediococcus pentosaceus]
MTKDELNEILKKQNLKLSRFNSGLGDTDITIMHGNGTNVLTITDEDNEFFERNMSKETLAAIVDYANTPIEERKPKPQLYNIIIAKDIHNRSPYLTSWRKVNKLGEYFVTDATEQHDLLHDNDFKFTIEEIEDLKSKVSEKQKQIIDIGTVKVEDTMSAGIDINEVEDE